MTPEIVDLLKKYKDHTLTKEEYERLHNWLSESEDNRQLMQNFVNMYKTVSRIDALHNADAGKAWARVSSIYLLRRRRLMLRRTLLAAACLLVLFVGGGALYKIMNTPETAPFSRLNKSVLLTSASGNQKILQNGGVLVCKADSTQTDTTKYNTITTQRGGNFKVVLPDKSVVWLNSNTTLQYPLIAGYQRLIRLKGEAFFEVMHTGAPFIVAMSGGNRVQVMGTQFNISAYSGRAMSATLVQGKVEVYNKVSHCILHPGQQAIATSGGSAISTREVDTSIYTSWITGVFDFNDTQLETIMEQLAEWYNIKVEYESSDLRNIRFTGSIYRDRSLDYSLGIIEFISNVKFKKQDDKLIVYSK